MVSDYKISVYSTRLGIPLNFFVHTYVVTEHAGVKNRYDVFAPLTLRNVTSIEPYNGIIYKNLLHPETGFLMWYEKKKWFQEDTSVWRWNVQMDSITSGYAGSPAHKLYTMIEDGHLDSYPFKEIRDYKMVTGANSNTFVQWVADLVPECNLTLPWNAWGKGYKRK